MKTYKVRDSQVVAIFTKAEAKCLLWGIQNNYFQKTKQRDRIISPTKRLWP